MRRLTLNQAETLTESVRRWAFRFQSQLPASTWPATRADLLRREAKYVAVLTRNRNNEDDFVILFASNPVTGGRAAAVGADDAQRLLQVWLRLRCLDEVECSPDLADRLDRVGSPGGAEGDHAA